eukprot:656303-Amphidinium_carterae.2
MLHAVFATIGRVAVPQVVIVLGITAIHEVSAAKHVSCGCPMRVGKLPQFPLHQRHLRLRDLWRSHRFRPRRAPVLQCRKRHTMTETLHVPESRGACKCVCLVSTARRKVDWLQPCLESLAIIRCLRMPPLGVHGGSGAQRLNNR